MRKNFIWFLLLVGIVVTACQPEPDAKKLLDDLVVSTNYDTDADFNSYLTYSLPTDTIGYVSNVVGDDTIVVAKNSAFPRPVLQAVQSNLDQRGFARVEKSANPDLGVNVLVVNDFNVFQQVVYPGGYYGPGSYYSGYYGYSGYYSYPYINTYAYNTGLLVVEIVDLKNRTPDNKVKVIWSAYMGDIYSTLDRIPQTVTALDQAFQQSQYIGTNGQ
jgi:hypothetical protein